jgi:glyoxylase-like metal-dependent hydrolase (beta-lactamase superfamily II)
MFFKQRTNEDASISYFFGCGGLGKGVAVDVLSGDEAWFMEEASRAGNTITHVIDTHVHADHRSGGLALAQAAHAAYCLHESNEGRVNYAFERLSDGQTLDIGNVKIQELHTPGHTPDSICLLVTDHRRGDAPWFVITGDTLFVGAVGRPDLGGHEREMASRLYDSLHARLLTLLDALEIFPAHQAGSVCGAGLSGKPCSTLGFEKRWNPALSMTREAFVDHVTGSIPPRPAGMDAIMRFNLGRAG